MKKYIFIGFSCLVLPLAYLLMGKLMLSALTLLINLSFFLGSICIYLYKQFNRQENDYKSLFNKQKGLFSSLELSHGKLYDEYTNLVDDYGFLYDKYCKLEETIQGRKNKNKPAPTFKN